DRRDGIDSEYSSLLPLLPGLQREVDRLERVAAPFRADFEAVHNAYLAARSNAEAAAKDVHIARQQAEAAYLASPPVVARRSAIAAADHERTDIRETALARLQNDPHYQRLLANAVQTERTIEILRDTRDADTRSLTEASQAWIEAKTELKRFERDAVSNDAATSAADRRYADLRALDAAELTRFREALPQDPSVAALIVIAHSKAAIAQQAEADAKAAEATYHMKAAPAIAARNRYNELVGRINSLDAARASARSDFSSLERQRSSIDSEIDAARWAVKELTDQRKRLEDDLRRVRESCP
ncbi:MAG TPA: hypothetical protein VGB55_16095, partial [Tepidisphaeraceae bacterium]